MEKLTKRQKEILDFIVNYLKNRQYAPSYMEIAEHLAFLRQPPFTSMLNL